MRKGFEVLGLGVLGFRVLRFWVRVLEFVQCLGFRV